MLHHQQHAAVFETRVCVNCGGPVWGLTRKGKPRRFCKLAACRVTQARHPKTHVFLQEEVGRAVSDAMDRPLPTLAQRQAEAARLEPVVLAELEVKARLGDVAAARTLLEYSSRLLDRASDEAQDWLSESPSEATDSR